LKQVIHQKDVYYSVLSDWFLKNNATKNLSRDFIGVVIIKISFLFGI
jgi:hypothetical protein